MLRKPAVCAGCGGRFRKTDDPEHQFCSVCWRRPLYLQGRKRRLEASAAVVVRARKARMTTQREKDQAGLAAALVIEPVQSLEDWFREAERA